MMNDKLWLQNSLNHYLYTIVMERDKQLSVEREKKLKFWYRNMVPAQLRESIAIGEVPIEIIAYTRTMDSSGENLSLERQTERVGQIMQDIAGSEAKIQTSHNSDEIEIAKLCISIQK